MPPTRKIRRVSSASRAESEGAVTTEDTLDEEGSDTSETSEFGASDLSVRVQTGERRIEELARRFKQVSDDAARAIGKAVQLSDELESLKNETLENMQVAFDENAEILEAIEKDVTDLKSRLHGVDAEAVHDLAQVRAGLEARTRDLETVRDQLRDDVDALKAEAAYLRGANQASGHKQFDERSELLRHEFELLLEAAQSHTDEAVAAAQRQMSEAVQALESLGFNGGTLASALTSMASRQRTEASALEEKLLSVQQSPASPDVKQWNERIEEEIARAQASIQRVDDALHAANGALERSERAVGQVEALEARLAPMVQQFEESARLVQASRESIELTMKLADDVEKKVRRLVLPVDGALDHVDEFEHFAPGRDLGFELHDLLGVVIKYNASDLHIKVGSPPMVRLDGELIPIGSEILTEDDCKRLIFGVISPSQRRRLLDRRELDFAFAIPQARFRINAFLQKGTVSAALRLLRTEMPTVEELCLPQILKKLALLHSGLILVTGPAGSGKSTTLAAMIEHINSTVKKHVITIEDPIEFVHSDKQSLITQREIGADTPSFAEALRQALRQDPNVVLIGEMRDPETIMTAAIAAETGHLVLSTMHTQNTMQAIDRMIDVFSGEQQRQFRLLLANTLRGVVSQRLLQRADQQGRVVAVEVLVVTPTISSLILEGKTNEIYPYLQQGGIEGMQTFTASLSRLYEAGLITKEEAMYHADQPTEFRLEVEGHTTSSMQYAEGDTLMNWL